MTHRWKRQQGRPERDSNPCHILMSHADSTTTLPLAYAFDLERRNNKLTSSVKPSTVSNHIGSIRTVIVLIQNVMLPSTLRSKACDSSKLKTRYDCRDCLDANSIHHYEHAEVVASQRTC